MKCLISSISKHTLIGRILQANDKELRHLPKHSFGLPEFVLELAHELAPDDEV
jgi:hypothetical protein